MNRNLRWMYQYLTIAIMMFLVSANITPSTAREYTVRNELAFVDHLHSECGNITDPKSLVDSIKRNHGRVLRPESQSEEPSKHRVLIVTYFTESIEHYAAYSLYSNYVWAKFVHDYELVLVNESYAAKNGLVEPRDERWNKVRILRHFLSIATAVDFIVWMDADLVVLNLNQTGGFDIESIIDSNYRGPPGEDEGEGGLTWGSTEMFISRDMADAPFVANTGLVILRNSPWSLRFLDQWWGRFDRGVCCDQHALNWLYHGAPDAGVSGSGVSIETLSANNVGDFLSPVDVRLHVRVLPASALGSDFPAYARQQSVDPVLHLAGQSDALVRQVVFRRGMRSVCQTLGAHLVTLRGWVEKGIASQSPPPPPLFPRQLGLTRGFLQWLALTHPCRQLATLTALTRELTDESNEQAGPLMDFDSDVGADADLAVVLASLERNATASLAGVRALNRATRRRMADALKQAPEIRSFADSLQMAWNHNETAEWMEPSIPCGGGINGSDTGDDYGGDVDIWGADCPCLGAVHRGRVAALVDDQQQLLQAALAQRFVRLAERAVNGGLRPLLLAARRPTRSADTSVVRRQWRLALVGLEILKEAFSVAVEFALLEQHAGGVGLSATDVRIGGIEGEADGAASVVGVLLLPFFSQIEDRILSPFVELAAFADAVAPDGSNARQTPLRAMGLYYQFKLQQLVASEHRRVLRMNPPLDQQWTHTHISVAESLQTAVNLWEEMAATYGYYGSGYVMADPYKEGYELRGELGGFLCLSPGVDNATRMEVGHQHITRSLELRELTLSGYGNMNIATVSVVTGETLALVEAYVGALMCLSGRLMLLSKGVAAVTTEGESYNLCTLARQYVQNTTLHLETLRPEMGSVGVDVEDRFVRVSRSLLVTWEQTRSLCVDLEGRETVQMDSYRSAESTKAKLSEKAKAKVNVKTTGSAANVPGGVKWRRKKKIRSDAT